MCLIIMGFNTLVLENEVELRASSSMDDVQALCELPGVGGR